jgi:putative IMPACT (imprinted ancient) family translation regulator
MEADGSDERSSDDGEPAGSAGRPILNELRSRELVNIAVFVVRYFGGKKLGVPGLIRAYRHAAADALNHAEIIIHEILEFYNLTCDKDELNEVMHLIHRSGAKTEHMEYAETCKFVISCKRVEKDKVLAKLSVNRKIKIEHAYSF